MMKLKKEDKLFLLLGLFIAALIAANLLGTKITYLFTESLRVSVGIFAVPITFLVTDIVEEVYGREKTKIFVYAGVLCLIFMFAIVSLSVYLPAHTNYASNEQYRLIFGSSLRMIFASIIAFFLSQMHDLWAFNFWKEKTKGKYLWLRNNLSTIVSQFLDTTIFMFIAFYGISPKFTAGFVFSLIIPYWLFKVAFAVMDTPLVYLGVRWLRGKD